MAPGPSLQIIIDGDSTRVYRRGDKVTGRVILVAEQEEEFKSLMVSFTGTCTTKTTRPDKSGNDTHAIRPRQKFEEHICLFNIEQQLLTPCVLVAQKYCWTFDFKFPDLTEPKYSRWQHGPKYHREPHPLPPSFQVQTHVPGGQAAVAYSVQARLVRSGRESAVETQQSLPYHPTPHDMPLEPRVTSRVLYAQTWKPLANSRTAIDKAFSKLSRRSLTSYGTPRIVPTLHYPEKISPGQHIPLLLTLTNTHELPNNNNGEQTQCILDSISVTITTHTTSICGQSPTQPEDIMTKHVNCLSKNNLNIPIAFRARTKLTNNFRLVDDAECVPSFKSYNITRRYDLIVAVGIKYEDRTFGVRCTTLLDILPRVPRELLPSVEDDGDDEVDPLPLYEPRELLQEFAPDYESLYSTSPTSLRSPFYNGSSSSSIPSGGSTPALEIEQTSYFPLPSRVR